MYPLGYMPGSSGGIAQLVEQTAHIRSVIGSSPIAAIRHFASAIKTADAN